VTTPLDLHGAAARLGCSYSWLQKNWRRLVRDEGFPSPHLGDRKHGRPRWGADVLDRWQEGRSLVPRGEAPLPAVRAAAPPAPANDLTLGQRPDRVSALIAAAGG